MFQANSIHAIGNWPHSMLWGCNADSAWSVFSWAAECSAWHTPQLCSCVPLFKGQPCSATARQCI